MRLERGRAILIMDVGSPPPLEAAGQAHAGCLAFEFSTATDLVFVNGGAPGPSHAEWRAASRATANHNTLCLGEKSSSKLIRHKKLEQLVGGAPIRFPDAVTAQIERHGDGLELTASHDGYVRRFGLTHRRTIALSGDGKRLVGNDRLTGNSGELRLRQDIPFAIRFHLHPDVVCRRAENPSIAILDLPSGETWQFTLEGAALSFEESTYFADSAGPRRALQIVARGATFGASEIRWVAEAQG
jgi:uncharacterized heparinase superfamily protein